MSASTTTAAEASSSSTDGSGERSEGAPSPLKGVASLAATPRILSMDQYRGYCVAGMFVVNFLGAIDVTHQFLKHNNTHFSWADSIMPGFLFACGFSFRLSVLKRVQKLGRTKTYTGVVRRSLALVLLSLMLYGVGGGFNAWSEMTREGIWNFLANTLKADLWEVLAIIGVLQLLLLGIVETGSRFRLTTIVVLSVTHVLISWSFNYWFVNGQPNWMDDIWGLEGRLAWDGGFFGLISWAIPMLAGTLVYDLMASRSAGKTVRPLLLWGCGLMLVGYGVSCLTRLYDVTESAAVPVETRGDEFADNPVLPPLANAQGRPLTSLLAEPPFVPPPSTEVRKLNYWMMDKRVVTQSFILFATGFSMAVYALFVLACDTAGWKLGVFRTFGQNALAAYVIHYPVELAVHQITPSDSPAWWTSIGLAIFFVITYQFVRFLEKNKLYLKL